MSFRARIAVGSAAAVALAVVLASVLVYIVAGRQLRAPIDDALRSQAHELSRQPIGLIESEGGETFLAVRPEFGEARGYVQLVRSNGDMVVPPRQHVGLPVDDDARAVVDGSRLTSWKSVEVSGTHLRVLTFAYGPGAAVQVARPLTEVDRSLDRIGLFLVVVAASGIVIAALLGLLVARGALGPVRRLTATAERVTETGDLSERIDLSGNDELGRLAASFNTMLEALEDSTRAQRQLVADASHELRTPLTSLRTNIEVLAGDHTLPADEKSPPALRRRRAARRDDDAHLGADRACSRRAADVGTGVRPSRRAGRGRRRRARRNRPGVAYTTDLEETVVRGVPSTIERAVGNLLDNAAKWSPPGAEVAVALHDGRLTVRDHGPGIADEDLPYVFDRFYRARAARGMPGSGLGLAIVRQVAEAHGGDVVAENVEGGGTRMTLRLNGQSAAVASS